MSKKRSLKGVAILLLVMFSFASFPIVDARKKKEDLSKDDLKKVAIAAVVLAPLAAPKKKPKPPKPEAPKVEIPGVEKPKPPENKKEVKEAKKAEKEKAANAAEAADLAFEEVKSMAEAGDMQAQYILGYAYYTGQQIEESDQEAIVWWNKAARQGHREADAYMGLAFAEGFGGSLSSEDEAIRRYKRAEKSGSAFAEVLLGIHGYQKETAEDKLVAMERFRSAASKGNPQAKIFLDAILKKGLDAKLDFGKDLEWKKEAKKTSLLALYTQAGINAFKGQIVEQNYEEAVAWWEISVECEDMKAEALLGTAYYTGRGIGKDYETAIELLKIAAAKGEPLAEYTLGKAYLEANGVKKNKDLAAKLFRAAGNAGIEEAKKMADKLEGRA